MADKKIEFNFGEASVKLKCNGQFKYKNDKDNKLHALQNIFDAIANLDKRENRIDSAQEKDLLKMLKEIFSADGEENLSEEELAWAGSFAEGGDVVEFLTQKYLEVKKGTVISEQKPKDEGVQSKNEEVPAAEPEEYEEENQARLKAEQRAKQKAEKTAQQAAFANGVNKIKQSVSTDGVNSGDYTVVRGDSLWKIAKKSLVAEGIERPTDKQVIDRLALIAKLNNIENVSAYKLLPGNTLKVPTTQEGNTNPPAGENPPAANPPAGENPPAANPPAGENPPAAPAENPPAAAGEESSAVENPPAVNTPPAVTAPPAEKVDPPEPQPVPEYTKLTPVAYTEPDEDGLRYKPREVDESKTTEVPRRFLGFLWKTGGKKVRTYDSDGNIISEVKYKRNGKAEQTTHYDSAGKKTHVVKTYDKGKVKSITAYDKNGKKLGKVKEFDENGDFNIITGKLSTADRKCYVYREDGKLNVIYWNSQEGDEYYRNSLWFDGNELIVYDADPQTAKLTKKTSYKYNGGIHVNQYNEDGDVFQQTAYKDRSSIAYVHKYDPQTRKVIRTDSYRNCGSLYSIEEYNDADFLTKNAYYQEDGETVDEFYLFEYNENQQTKRLCYDGNGNVTGFGTYEYHENGQIFRETHYKPDGTLYYYNEQNEAGNYTRVTELSDGDHEPEYYWIYEYNDEGEQISEKKFNLDGTPYVEPQE